MSYGKLSLLVSLCLLAGCAQAEWSILPSTEEGILTAEQVIEGSRMEMNEDDMPVGTEPTLLDFSVNYDSAREVSAFSLDILDVQTQNSILSQHGDAPWDVHILSTSGEELLATGLVSESGAIHLLMDGVSELNSDAPLLALLDADNELMLSLTHTGDGAAENYTFYLQPDGFDALRTFSLPEADAVLRTLESIPPVYDIEWDVRRYEYVPEGSDTVTTTYILGTMEAHGRIVERFLAEDAAFRDEHCGLTAIIDVTTTADSTVSDLGFMLTDGEGRSIMVHGSSWIVTVAEASGNVTAIPAQVNDSGRLILSEMNGGAAFLWDAMLAHEAAGEDLRIAIMKSGSRRAYVFTLDCADLGHDIETVTPFPTAEEIAAKEALREAVAAFFTEKPTVTYVQKALNSRGYDCGTADGVAGAKTEAAINLFRADNALPQTGAIDNALLAKLGYYDARETVKAVQTGLNAHGYDCGTPDGVAGANTEAAIRAFQHDNINILSENGRITAELLLMLR